MSRVITSDEDLARSDRAHPDLAHPDLARPDLARVEPIDLREVRADVREAYERGRRDERASRRRHPLGMTLLFVVAACGAALLALAATNGSFAGGGRVADEQLSSVVGQAQPAAADAGQSLRDASEAAKAKVQNSTSN